MIVRTLLWVGWLRLRRDPVALGLIFVLPLVFFSIFALVFGTIGLGRGTTVDPLPVLLVDEDGSEASRGIREALQAQPALELIALLPAVDGAPAPLTREVARERIRRGDEPVALIFPPGFGAAFQQAGPAAAKVELVYDAANPVARFLVGGLLEYAALSAAPRLLLGRGMELLQSVGVVVPPAALGTLQARMEQAAAGGGRGWTDALIQVQADDVRGDDTGLVAYFAAGVGVMFLLFSMAGAGGSLMDERDSGTLGRMLDADVPLPMVLLANWLFFAMVGATQVSLMFVWGWLAFDLELWTLNRVLGCLLMTAVTAAAAAAFGVVMATACGTRAQLAGISTIVVLIMSALGGSMVPRFVMPPFMADLGLVTFNGWALEGFLKVFWYDDPAATLGGSLFSLAGPAGVLVAVTLVFLLLAVRLARRWEAA